MMEGEGAFFAALVCFFVLPPPAQDVSEETSTSTAAKVASNKDRQLAWQHGYGSYVVSAKGLVAKWVRQTLSNHSSLPR